MRDVPNKIETVLPLTDDNCGDHYESLSRSLFLVSLSFPFSGDKVVVPFENWNEEILRNAKHHTIVIRIGDETAKFSCVEINGTNFTQVCFSVSVVEKDL